MAKQSFNLITNYHSTPHDYGGRDVLGGHPGLQLWVRSALVHEEGEEGELVPSAEIVSERDDILYGSFRIAMKTSSVNGTCAAFYFYRNDSQELDVEVLSAEQVGGKGKGEGWPVHLVVQNTTVDLQGDEAVEGSKQMVWRLESAPSEDYNEYRFDWLPGRVEYYLNGGMVWSTGENVPSSAGRVHISHWSNGNPFWSHGPPLSDAVMTVSYVKAYFNSTNSTRNSIYQSFCPPGKASSSGKTCEVPTQSVAPNAFGNNGNTTGRTFFFTHHPDMVVNQTVYDPAATENAASSRRWELASIWLFVLPWIFVYDSSFVSVL
ncbi:uncharacterized protein LTR77_011165 [Saxophila tyrrhenica]|uniref:GH16 domain-containing protein n=1 Tax=Saxophila tyrrhenica TaxID=1690608 RepID=A0AAV9NWM8_9PEZI|nr:hypothetical protein LTR77_011165 [Saxophila tyrrhenica]